VQWAIETETGWTRNHKVLLMVSYGAYALQYVHAAANPFLYVFLTDAFRQNVCRLLGRKKELDKTYSLRGGKSAVDETVIMLTPPSGCREPILVTHLRTSKFDPELEPG